MSEKFYDEVIAPELARIAKLCTDNNMSLVAAVEYEPGEIAQTRMFSESATWPIEMVDLAVASCGNVDKFIISVAKLADSRPDLDAESSLVLRVLQSGAKE